MTRSKNQEIWILSAAVFGERHIGEGTLKYESLRRCSFTTVVLLSTRRMSRARCLCFRVCYVPLLCVFFFFLKKTRSDEEITTLSRSGERNKKLNQAQSSLKRRRREAWLALIPACSQVCCVTRTVILRTYIHLHDRLSRGSRHPNRIECREPRDASRRRDSARRLCAAR